VDRDEKTLGSDEMSRRGRQRLIAEPLRDQANDRVLAALRSLPDARRAVRLRSRRARYNHIQTSDGR
jgi:hypothetical protein